MTQGDSEAQLEAQLRAAILRTFPWLPGEELKHQVTFTFQLGHNNIVIRGVERASVRGRADVLVNFRGSPLAMFELKRDGEALTADDEAQCLSYARMLHPRPPLAVVTNGTDTVLLETHTGQPWTPASPSEAGLAALLRSATHAAGVDLKQAVAVLMGQDRDVWMQAVRAVTDATLEERTGAWDDLVATFVRGFILPRKVTFLCHALLEKKQRLIVVAGEPLSGKSSVLRELALRHRDSDQLAMLYLDADAGIDIFQRLALLLSDALAWPLTADEALHWLKQLSQSQGPALVILIDNVGPGRDDLRRNLETLSSNHFGPGLRLVLATDDTVAEEMQRTRQGRGVSTFGRRAALLPLGPLDDEEFGLATEILGQHRMGFVNGGQHSMELRMPWIIRAMATHAATADNYANTTLVAAMSPIPSLELIEFARQNFDASRGPFNLYRELAVAILEDAQDRSKPYALTLELLHNFIVRRATALQNLGESELQAMTEKGLIREARSHAGDNIYVVRIPELMASELAKLVTARVGKLSKEDPKVAAEWLTTVANSLPLGDVIAAEAIIDAALQGNGMDLRVISELRMRPPRREPFHAGTRASVYMPGFGPVELEFNEQGKVFVLLEGQRIELSDEDCVGEAQMGIVDVHPYLILAHLAGHQLAVRPPGQADVGRLDPDLLAGVGAVPVTLRRPTGDPEIGAVLTHEIGADLSIVCHKAGVVEPITWSLVRFFGREDEAIRDQFLDYALEDPKPALLARMDIALRQTAGSADTARAAWAQRVRDGRLAPLINVHLRGFTH